MNWKMRRSLTQKAKQICISLSSRLYGRRLLGIILASLIAANILFLISQFISGYYNYGAESITISQMLRISRSESYISNIPDIPLMISSFTPLLFWLFEPFIKILSLNSIIQIATLGRVITLIIVAGCIYLLKKFLTKQFENSYDNKSFLVSILWFTAMFPGAIISIRPDFLSFIFELAAFILFFDLSFSSTKGPHTRNFTLSAIFISLGIAAKQNTIGVFAGIIIYLIVTKKYTKALTFSGLTLATTSGAYFFYTLMIGSRFGTNTMQSLLNRPGLDLQSLFLAVTNIIQSTFYPYAIFYLLAATGLLIIAKDSKHKAILLATCLGSSFIFATVGQLKPGAWLNYHFGFFLLATVPVSISLKTVFASKHGKRPIHRALQLTIAITILVNIILGALGSLKIVANYRMNYPYIAVQSYVSKNYPTGLIYTPDEDLALLFHDRVALAPWAETILDMTPSMRSILPAQQALLKDYEFSVAVKSGNNCTNWRPSGDFVDSTKHLSSLRKKMGNICIFDEG